jgi:hypothetical protein
MYSYHHLLPCERRYLQSSGLTVASTRLTLFAVEELNEQFGSELRRYKASIRAHTCGFHGPLGVRPGSMLLLVYRRFPHAHDFFGKFRDILCRVRAEFPNSKAGFALLRWGDEGGEMV